ncbi:3-deoxy-manno-octulosonate cytidylyltransferase [Neisseria gonorrhoeae]|nr:3-deoxy-manno-octulosonate cytidylyltransferase [Neisseria gonorrhoeae]
MATAGHELHDFDELMNPNAVKVVLDKNGNAIYFSRAPIPYPRDAMRAGKREMPSETAVLRHIGIYAYRAGFLQRYAEMSVSPLETIESLEQLRVLWHGYPIAVETAKEAPAAGVDTQEDLDRVRAVFQTV